MPIRVRICDACDETFDVFCRDTKGEYIHLGTHAVTDAPQCSCGNRDLRNGVTPFKALWTGDESGYGKIYPYYDRSLKMRIHNKQHHDRVMRENHLVHYEDADLEAIHAAEVRENEENIAWSKDYDERLEHDPAFREYREQRAKGMFVEDVPKHLREKAQKHLMRNDVR